MIFYSADTNGFHDSDLMVPPAGAVEITAARHAQLMDFLSAGRTIEAGADGRPRVVASLAPDRDHLVADFIEAVKSEAERRILEAAPIWQQCNDAGILADLGWRPEAELSSSQIMALSVTRTRRAWIDSVRASSNIIGSAIETMTSGQLARVDVVNAPEWPETLIV